MCLFHFITNVTSSCCDIRKIPSFATLYYFCVFPASLQLNTAFFSIQHLQVVYNNGGVVYFVLGTEEPYCSMNAIVAK